MFGRGRQYTSVVVEATITTLHDLIKIVSQTNKITVIDAITVTTDAGAAEDMEIVCMRATGGGTATPIVPTKDDLGDALYAGLVYDMTGDSNSTPGDVKKQEKLDVRSGFYWEPGNKLILPGSGIFVVKHNVTLAVGVNMVVSVDFTEIG